MNAGIIGLGTYAPEHVLTNEDLEKEWIHLTNGLER